MTKKPTKTGKALERRVADAYRAMGARKVEHDVELAGHQIDVYVEMETADRALHRIAVEAKDYSKPVGIEIVSGFAAVVAGLRTLKLVDEGVVVSAAGFSKQARNAAEQHGLRLLEPADLDAMAGLPNLEQMRADYLASLRQRFEYLDLGGIAPRVQNRTVKLRMDDVFIPVQARPELEPQGVFFDSIDINAGEDLLEKIREALTFPPILTENPTDKVKPVEIPDLLGHPRVVILGDPGCGKSTLLRHVAYAVACGKAESVGKAPVERLPIFVRIVQFSQALVQDATLTLDTYIREVVEPKWSPLFQHALDRGKALVLLDGLDEVVDAHQRKDMADAIQQLAADYSTNSFLVTSRIVGYQAARLSGDFAHYTIQPLPLERIATFVEKWYAAIDREAGETELSEEARERARELSLTIQERPGICRLAENPLLLTIIALLNWRGRKLPNRRVELYAHAAETLIESWPYRRQGAALDTERVIRLLSPVAYRIFAVRSSGDIAEDDLLPILVEAICHVDGTDERAAKGHAEEFLAQISERSGIFRERGYDERGRRVFGFLHLTFAEYFTARYLAGLWEGMEDTEARQAFLRKYAHVPRWHEVVLLMASDIGLRDNDRAERATRLLSDILTMDSDYEECLHRDLLLAGECLTDDLCVQPQGVRYVVDKLAELTCALSANISALAESTYANLLVKPLIERLKHTDATIRANAARTLGQFGDTQAIESLVQLLRDPEDDVQYAAARALGRLGYVPTAEELLRTINDGEVGLYVTLLRALGKAGDASMIEPLLPLLKHQDENIRRDVAWLLGALGDVQAAESLLELLEDRDPTVRAITAHALAFLEVDEAFEPLLTLLRDTDPGVRARAALALGGLSNVRAVDSLLDRLTDSEPEVRYQAAFALGQLADTRAVEPLLALLGDGSGEVRSSASYALGLLGDMQALEPLLALVGDEEPDVRGLVACALGTLGDERGLVPLLTLLKDKEPIVRMYAAEAAWKGQIQDICMLEPLLTLLEDEDWFTRLCAHRAAIAILEQNVAESEVKQMTCEPQNVSGPWDN